MRLVILLLAVACPLPRLGAQAAEFPGTDDKWRHFRSPSFELYSRNREGESRELLHNLELLRALFLDTFKLTEKRRLEVTIYYFRSANDFRSYVNEVYGTKHGFAGLYVSGVDRAVIMLSPGEDAASARQLIFHEYVHHLFRVSEQVPPSWFNEGMAELFSTVTPKSGKMELGHPVVGRLWQLKQGKLMPLEQLFAVDQSSPILRQGEHTGLFYAESWAMMHYLYFGNSKIPDAQRNAFLKLALVNRFKDGGDMRKHFRGIFGMDYPEMQERLEGYVSGGSYSWRKIPMPEIPPAAGYATRPVPRREMGLRLAELALRVSRSARAKLALLQAKEQDPRETRALEALGSDALRDENQQGARERWTEAVERGTRNPAIYRELGLMEGRGIFSQFDVHFRVPEEKVRRLRDYLLRAIEYNPEQSDAYEMLAWVEAFAPEPSIKNLNVVQRAYGNLSRQQRTALALAFVRVRLGSKEEALAMLADLQTMAPDPWETYGIEAIRAHVEGRPIRPENLHPDTWFAPGRVKIQPPKSRLGN